MIVRGGASFVNRQVAEDRDSGKAPFTAFFHSIQACKQCPFLVECWVGSCFTSEAGQQSFCLIYCSIFGSFKSGGWLIVV